jgi:nucleolar protein 12
MESNYLRESMAAEDSGDDPSEESDEDADFSPPIHESLTVKKDQRISHSVGKRKHAPSDETSEKRDARTIFIGNLPVEVAKSKVCVLNQ